MLKAKNISLSIDGKTLLDDINIDIAENSFVCVAGANGAGKTLLLKILGGVIVPTNGAVFFDGQNIAFLGARQKSRFLRFLPAQPESVFNYKVGDVVLMGANPYIAWWENYRAADKAAALKAMQNTNTAALEDRGVLTLSDGERQRVFAAQALAGGPKIILPDEPSSHLDLKQKDIIFKLFADIARDGAVIICATHDIEMAKKHATHICLLEEGRLKDFAPAAKITDSKIKKVYGL